MAITHCQSIADYTQYLTVNPAEVAELTMAFLIKVTEFFRDPEAFAFLAERVVPDLVARGRENNRVVRCWSAGCATGEEPYSLALLLADHLGSELAEWSIKIFATDIDDGPSSSRAAASSRRTRSRTCRRTCASGTSTRPTAASGSRRPSARWSSSASRTSAARAVPAHRLLVCRNLLIYFKPDLQQQILDSFAYSLSRNGYLFSERPRPHGRRRPSSSSPTSDGRSTGASTARRDQANQSSHRGVAAAAEPARDHARARVRRRAGASADAVDAGISSLRRFNELVLRLLPVGVVVVDRAYRIVTISGAARRLARRARARPRSGLPAHGAGLPYARVRSAIDAVFRDKTAVTLAEIELDPATGGDGRYLLLNVVPMQAEIGMPDLGVISITDVTEQVQTRRRLEAVQAEQAQLVDELARRTALGELNKELPGRQRGAAGGERGADAHAGGAAGEQRGVRGDERGAAGDQRGARDQQRGAAGDQRGARGHERRAHGADAGALPSHENARDGQTHLTRAVDLAPYGIAVLRGSELEVEYVNAELRASVRRGRGHRAAVRRSARRRGERRGDQVCTSAYHEDAACTISTASAGGRVTCVVVPMHDGFGDVDGLTIYAQRPDRHNRGGSDGRSGDSERMHHRTLAVTVFVASAF
jgi:two-component system CheB/CheR fusion protein